MVVTSRPKKTWYEKCDSTPIENMHYIDRRDIPQRTSIA